MCLMILSLWISLPFMASFRRYKKTLLENETRASIHKQVEELKTNKDVEEINNMIFDLELDISESDKHIFSSQSIWR